MQGYYKNQEASDAAVDDEGYFRTGDLGHIDDNGLLYIIDRKKQVVVCQGYQIQLCEIENLIEMIEGVNLVSVVAIPDAIAENLPAAVIVKRPGFEAVTEKFIADYVAERLPFYKHLHGGVYFVDKMPTTASGKVYKRLITNIVTSKMSQ